MKLYLLDFVFIGVLGIFFLMSFFRGTLREIISLIGVLAGFVAAHWYYVQVGDLIAPVVQNASLAEAVAYVAIVVVGYLVGAFASGIGDYYSAGSRSLGHRLFAGLIGLLKGLTICLALYWLIATHVPPLQDELSHSGVAARLGQVMAALQGWKLL